MMQKSYISVCLFLFLPLLSGCVEKSGYYDEGEQTIIDNLTDNKSWERTFHSTSHDNQECEMYELWIFKNNGTGSHKYVITYEDGRTEKGRRSFHWSFTMPDFSVIYMDYGTYWDIKKLTPDKLCIYETYDDPVTVPGQTYREYKEFESQPLSVK